MSIGKLEQTEYLRYNTRTSNLYNTPGRINLPKRAHPVLLTLPKARTAAHQALYHELLDWHAFIRSLLDSDRVSLLGFMQYNCQLVLLRRWVRDEIMHEQVAFFRS